MGSRLVELEKDTAKSITSHVMLQIQHRMGSRLVELQKDTAKSRTSLGSIYSASDTAYHFLIG
jgi:hypothetical protein